MIIYGVNYTYLYVSPWRGRRLIKYTVFKALKIGNSRVLVRKQHTATVMGNNYILKTS